MKRIRESSQISFALVLVLVFGLAQAAPREVHDHHWVDVERIVAIGDLHGDYDNYMQALRAAGIVDRRGRWDAGETHLVQTGDIPDRGPATRKIIEHMARLARQARRSGGRVHNLIGNHEAMNVYGDLRYVINEEYAEFATARSERFRDRYFDAVLKDLEQRDPKRFANLPENFREQWYEEHPPGWIEHRQAWDPRWNPDGEMFQWVMDSRVSIQINDLIFVHGGISGFYCRDSLESMTDRAHAALERSDPEDLGILTDEYGPLWYRGLAGMAPETPVETVEAILEQHQASHIVIGHTPTGGFIWPRYAGRVIQIDTGIGSAYGGHVAYLEVTPEGMFAGYRSGRVELPEGGNDLIAYLESVIELLPENRAARERLQQLRQLESQESESENTGTSRVAASSNEQAGPTASVPICGTRL
ncbi:MAG: metallophosphoesterase [Wenzhouxiangellaceae bacterium]